MSSDAQHWILRTHPRFDAMSQRWQFYLDHYVGGDDYCEKANPISISDGSGVTKPPPGHSGVSRYLWQHPLEATDRYRHRLNRGFFVDILSPIVDFYAAAVGKGVQIGVEDKNFAAFVDDADLRGNSLLQCLLEARTNAQVFGLTFLFVDSTRAEAAPVTERDVREMGIRPYLREITPRELRNWRCNQLTGEIEEVIFEVFAESTVLLSEEREPAVRQFYHWTQTEWSHYAVQKGDGGDVVAKIGGGPNHAGMVTICPLFHKRCTREGPLAGESLLKNTARTAMLLTNWASGMDEAIENQMFAVAVLKSRKTPTEVGVGMTNVLPLNPDENEEFGYVAPPTAPFESVWTAFFRLWAMTNVLMGAEAPNISDTPENKSGISKQWDYIKADKIMRRMSLNEQEAVKMILHFAGLWMDPSGKKQFEGQVQYPSEFDTASVQEDLSAVIQAQAAGFPPAVLRELRKKYVAKALPSIDEKTAHEIDGQLNQAALEPFPEDDPVPAGA